NYKYFDSDMTRFVNDNNFTSTSKYMLVTNLKSRNTFVFEKDNNNAKWVQLYKYKSTVGKLATPTITGTFYITGRKPYFGTDEYRVKYATRIRGAYYYHSILYDSKGIRVIDSRLGQALSHGCIRLDTANAKWIYENIPDGTTVFIH
ncbi:MAG: L,D-transpeptidase, partial [Romboutsia sp.]|nr:L,D-transpeptidase [Romboutsia sp.]